MKKNSISVTEYLDYMAAHKNGLKIEEIYKSLDSNIDLNVCRDFADELKKIENDKSNSFGEDMARIGKKMLAEGRDLGIYEILLIKSYIDDRVDRIRRGDTLTTLLGGGKAKRKEEKEPEKRKMTDAELSSKLDEILKNVDPTNKKEND